MATQMSNSHLRLQMAIAPHLAPDSACLISAYPSILGVIFKSSLSHPQANSHNSIFKIHPESDHCSPPLPVPSSVTRTIAVTSLLTGSCFGPYAYSVLHSAAREILLNPKTNHIPSLLTSLCGFLLIHSRSQSPLHGYTTSLSSPPATLPVAHSGPATQVSLFLTYAKHLPTSGPLH